MPSRKSATPSPGRIKKLFSQLRSSMLFIKKDDDVASANALVVGKITEIARKHFRRPPHFVMPHKRVKPGCVNIRLMKGGAGFYTMGRISVD